MAVVAILDLWEKCSYYIYDTILDVFLVVENIGVDSKINYVGQALRYRPFFVWAN